MIVLFLVLSFPIQVYTASPLPSLIPYLILSSLYVFIFLRNKKLSLNILPLTKVSIFILSYTIFLFLKIVFEFIFKGQSLENLFTNLLTYLFPVLFFFYFRKKSSEIEIKWFFYAMITASILCGIFFSYDSYNKFALRKTTNYANASYEYSLKRSNQTEEEANEARVRVGFKSFGLLESHSVSGAWLLLGLFAFLTLVPQKNRRKRTFVILLFGSFLFIGLNFTSIIVFIVTMLLFELQLVSFFFGKIHKKLIFNVFIIFFLIFLIVSGLFLTLGSLMSTGMIDLILVQLSFIFSSKNAEGSQIYILLNKLSLFSDKLYDQPLLFIFGSVNEYGKGGDIGFFDSMITFGLCFYFIVLFALFNIFRSSAYKVRKDIVDYKAFPYRNNIFQFMLFIITMVLLTDIHYSIWSAKSVLPIIFFSLALYDRYGNINKNNIKIYNNINSLETTTF
jgi:hypothetical protein